MKALFYLFTITPIVLIRCVVVLFIGLRLHKYSEIYMNSYRNVCFTAPQISQNYDYDVQNNFQKSGPMLINLAYYSYKEKK